MSVGSTIYRRRLYDCDTLDHIFEFLLMLVLPLGEDPFNTK